MTTTCAIYIVNKKRKIVSTLLKNWHKNVMWTHIKFVKAISKRDI